MATSIPRLHPRIRLQAGILPLLFSAALLLGSRPAHAQKSLQDYVQPTLKDLSASVNVLSHKDDELRKIGAGYVDAYTLTDREIFFREPGQARLQGKKGVLTIRYVTNGGKRLTEVPSLRVRKVEDIADEPGKGDSISDIGVITANWVSRVESRWIRSEERNGKTLQVFEFWYSDDPKAKNTVWLDPASKTIVERIAHHRNRSKPGFKKRIVFSDVKTVNGVQVPTRATLFSGDNKQAAQVSYERIKVNAGLADSLFKI